MARGQILRTNQAEGTQLETRAGAAEGKGVPHLGKVRASLWLPGLLAAEGKGVPHPGRVRPSPWLPELLSAGKTQNAGATKAALLWRT